MTNEQQNRLLGVRVAFVAGVATQDFLLEADPVADWLRSDDSQVRRECLTLALTRRTGGSLVEGLLSDAKAIYVYVTAEAHQASPVRAAEKFRSGRAAPRGVRE